MTNDKTNPIMMNKNDIKPYFIYFTLLINLGFNDIKNFNEY
jgi:hypothetical protein